MVKQKKSLTGVALLSKVSRISLKISLSTKRGMTTSRGWRPICAICGEPIMEDPDMHEAIITRGNVQGNFLLEELINTEENCVLTHPGGKNLGTCHQLAHTREGREKCIMHILKYVPVAQVLQWLEQMSLKMKSSLPMERMEEVNRIWRAMPVDHRHLKVAN